VVNTFYQQTFTIILPIAFIQLLTGFTMLSLKRHPINEIWITGSIIGFIVFALSWLAFVFVLTPSRSRIQTGLLSLSILSLLTSIFFMANKIHG
jgi:uncharacterized membrane protein